MSFDLDLYVTSTVLDRFFQYLVQMITNIRRCAACDVLWPWPISSRSYDLDFENHVHSVTFSVLDRLFPYLPQIITTIRGCVEFLVYNKILKFQFFAFFSAFTLFWLGIRCELVNSMDLGFKMNWSIIWVIMGQRGVSSERRRSGFILCPPLEWIALNVIKSFMLTLPRWPYILIARDTLTHWGQDKMAVVFQTTYSNAFSWIQIWISIEISVTFFS